MAKEATKQKSKQGEVDEEFDLAVTAKRIGELQRKYDVLDGEFEARVKKAGGIELMGNMEKAEAEARKQRDSYNKWLKANPQMDEYLTTLESMSDEMDVLQKQMATYLKSLTGNDDYELSLRRRRGAKRGSDESDESDE